MDEQIDTEFTYIPPRGADILTDISVSELAALRATDAAVRAAYERYCVEWAFISERLLSLPAWLAWLASDASTPPLGEEVKP